MRKLRGNGENMRKLRGNEEIVRKWSARQNEREKELDTVNYANPTTETRTQVLELALRY